jgi:hypothetical protein
LEGGGEVSANYQSFPPPTIFRLGSAMSLYQNPQSEWLVSLQLNHPVDNAENIALGTELLLWKKMALRGGYKINYDEEEFTFGGGVKIPLKGYNLDIDYCYSDFGFLGEAQRFSMVFWF